MARNYQQELECILRQTQGTTPKLLLHCCCAPCASYVLEYLSPHFLLTAYYYNPNIDAEEEYAHRAGELRRLAREMPLPGAVDVCMEPFTPDAFYHAIRGLEQIPEGGQRCYACYALRLEQTAKRAAENSCAFFSSTLSISPHKNAVWLNELGERFAAQYGVRWLYSDFKKRNGFKRSTELAAQYGLYRQNYCGCVFSKREAEARAEQKRAGAAASARETVDKVDSL